MLKKDSHINMRMSMHYYEKWLNRAEKRGITISAFVIMAMLATQESRLLPTKIPKFQKKIDGKTVCFKLPAEMKKEWELKSKFFNLNLTEFILARVEFWIANNPED